MTISPSMYIPKVSPPRRRMARLRNGRGAGENVFHAEIEAGGGGGDSDQGPVIQGEVGGGGPLVKKEGSDYLKDNREEEAAKTEPKGLRFHGSVPLNI